MRNEPRNEREANLALLERSSTIKQGTHFLTPVRRSTARRTAPVSLVSRLCSLLCR